MADSKTSSANKPETKSPNANPPANQPNQSNQPNQAGKPIDQTNLAQQPRPAQNIPEVNNLAAKENAPTSSNTPIQDAKAANLDSPEEQKQPYVLAETEEYTSNWPEWLSDENGYKNSDEGKGTLCFRQNRDTVHEAEFIREGSNGEGFIDIKTPVGVFLNVGYSPDSTQEGKYFFADQGELLKIADAHRRNSVDPNRHP